MKVAEEATSNGTHREPKEAEGSSSNSVVMHHASNPSIFDGIFVSESGMPSSLTVSIVQTATGRYISAVRERLRLRRTLFAESELRNSARKSTRPFRITAPAVQ